MVLVTGATGFVGSRLVTELVQANIHVRALVRSRPGRPAALTAPQTAECVSGDVLDPESLRSAAQGCDAVVHTVAIRRQWGQRTFAAITAQGTENMVNAAKKAGIEHFVLISALGLTNSPVTGYMQAKLQAEQAVITSGLPYTIFRPSFIVGPGGFVAEYAHLIKMAPVIPIPGDGGYPVQPIDIGDVAAAVLCALAEPGSDAIYDLAGPDRVTFYEFIGYIMAALGTRKTRLRMPLGIMRLVANITQRFTPNPPVTTEEITMLIAGNVGDPRPAINRFKFTLTPLTAAIAGAVATLRNQEAAP